MRITRVETLPIDRYLFVQVHTDEGIVAAGRIRDAFPGVGVLVLSQYVEVGLALTLLAESAEGVGGSIDGFSASQRFFLAYARVWATNDRPEFARLITKTNEHPLDRFRAIGAPSKNPASLSARYGT